MTTTKAPVLIDMHEVRLVLTEVSRLVAELDGYTTAVDPQEGNGRKPNREAAEVSRQLLRTSELLRLAGAELTTQYWALKGYPDPRYPADI